MTFQLIDIPGFSQPTSSKWKIKALQINGVSPAIAALVEWEQTRQTDYKQILNVMKQVASHIRVKNTNQVKKTANPRKHGDIYEMRAHTNHARLFFFYDDENENVVVCTNAFVKGTGNQNQAFAKCGTLKKYYESEFNH